MTDSIDEAEPTPALPPADSWEAILENLRRRHPGQKDSVLFCIYKLQQNPTLTLADLKDEARLHGIPTAGRALHSAKQLLGIVKPVPRVVEAPAEPPARRIRTPRMEETDDGASIESKVVAAVRQIQSAAGAEAETLRAAMRQAIALMQRALGD